MRPLTVAALTWLGGNLACAGLLVWLAHRHTDVDYDDSDVVYLDRSPIDPNRLASR